LDLQGSGGIDISQKPWAIININIDVSRRAEDFQSFRYCGSARLYKRCNSYSSYSVLDGSSAGIVSICLAKSKYILRPAWFETGKEGTVSWSLNARFLHEIRVASDGIYILHTSATYVYQYRPKNVFIDLESNLEREIWKFTCQKLPRSPFSLFSPLCQGLWTDTAAWRHFVKLGMGYMLLWLDLGLKERKGFRKTLKIEEQ